MIITAVCITRIQLIYWSVTWKVELFKKNAKILDTGYQVSKEIAFAKVKKRKLFFIRRIKKINFPFLPEIVVIYIRHIQNIKQYIGYREISGYEGLVACGERFMSYKEFMLYAVGRNIRISYGRSGIKTLIPTGDFLF